MAALYLPAIVRTRGPARHHLAVARAHPPRGEPAPSDQPADRGDCAVRLPGQHRRADVLGLEGGGSLPSASGGCCGLRFCATRSAPDWACCRSTTPNRFMPPQFSTLGVRMNDMYVESLTYIGPDGERIVRPPGLSDQPGGAAATGALAVATRSGPQPRRAARRRASVLTLASVGDRLDGDLPDTGALAAAHVGRRTRRAGGLLFRRGQVQVAARIAAHRRRAGRRLLPLGTVRRRRVRASAFLSITQQGALRTYQENRGDFVTETFGELLDQVSARSRRRPLGDDERVFRQSRRISGLADLGRDPAHGMAARRRRADVGLLRERHLLRAADRLPRRRAATSPELANLALVCLRSRCWLSASAGPAPSSTHSSASSSGSSRAPCTARHEAWNCQRLQDRRSSRAALR